MRPRLIVPAQICLPPPAHAGSLFYHAFLCFYSFFLHGCIVRHLYSDIHRLDEAYYYDANGKAQPVSMWQCFQYLFVQ